jgi:hypothetical protein
MNSAHRRITFASSLCLIFLGLTMTAAAQYYPPPPPPYPPPSYRPPPPPYPPPPYPPRPQYPPQGPDAQGQNYPPQRYPKYERQVYLSPYATLSAGHYSGLGAGNGTSPTESGGMTALGGTFGGYVMYPSPGPVQLGVDMRLIVENSANSTQFGNKILGGLVGLRIDGSGSLLPVVPYFQFEVGGAGTNNGTSRTLNGAFAYQAQFGADFPLVSRQVSARMEYGTGQLTGISDTSHTLQTFSVGIVFHLR